MVEFNDNKIILAFFVGIIVLFGVAYLMNNLNKEDISGKAVDITGRQIVDISVSGGVTENIPLGKAIANSTIFGFDWEFDDTDIPILKDTQINFQGKDYDVHEELVLSKYSPSVETSLTSQDDDYRTDIFLESIARSVKIYYVFGDKINVSKVTFFEPLTINFLGKNIRIISVGDQYRNLGNKFTVLFGTNYSMNVGDTIIVNGKKITLLNVGEGGSILVDVDGVRETISANSKEVVNGFLIYNLATFYTNEVSERFARIMVGDNIELRLSLRIGESHTIQGKIVTLLDSVGCKEDGTHEYIVVSVNGESATILYKKAMIINEIEIINDGGYCTPEGIPNEVALLVNDSEVEYQDGDAFIGEDENDPDWVWIIHGLVENSATTVNVTQAEDPVVYPAGPVIGIQNEFTKDDDTDNPPGVGGCYDLPNYYFSICLDSLTVPDNDYLGVTIKLTNVDTAKSGAPDSLSNAKVIDISASGNDRFIIKTTGWQSVNSTNQPTDAKTNQIWLQDTNGGPLLVFYKDPNKNPSIVYAGNITGLGTDWGFPGSPGFPLFVTFAEVNFGNTKGSNVLLQYSNTTVDNAHQIAINVSGDAGYELADGDDFILTNWTSTNGIFSSLGRTASVEEATELIWRSNEAQGLFRLQGEANLGTKDEDHRTTYGIIIKDPKSNGILDQVVLLIPGDQVQANVRIAERTCYDSDDGINYYIKGYATGYSSSEGRVVTKEDYCWATSSDIPTLSGPYAEDWFCENNLLFGSFTNCNCYDGTCVTTTTTTSSTTSSTTSTTLPRCGRDSFNRANNNNLGPEWAVVGGSWKISANKAYSTNPYSVAYWKNQMITTDQFSQAVFQATSYPSVDLTGPAVRIKDANSFYALVGISMDRSVYLIKREKGKDTFLGWYGLPDMTTTLALKASGNQIIPIMNGVKKPAVIDSSLTSGYSGIVKGNSYAAGNLDDWTMCESTIF